jgi:Sec-independent protein translocase protein TatA
MRVDSEAWTIGVSEVLLVSAVLVLMFGARKLPDLARAQVNL